MWRLIDSGKSRQQKIERKMFQGNQTAMESTPKPLLPLWKAANNLVGLLVMLVLANKWSNYLQTLHENEMWFSNIKASTSGVNVMK
jgi:hypothetical protein